MTDYQHSRFNILVPLREGRVLAHNGLSGATAVWERDEVDAFAAIGNGVPSSEDITSSLVYGGFVVPSGVDELLTIRKQFEWQRFDPTRMTLTIVPTLICNFGCDYCFQGSEKPREAMRQDIQDAVVNLVTRAADSIKRLSIAWYGGEPLLAIGIIESLSFRLMALAKERGLQYGAMIVTNGYRLTPEVASTLVRLNVKSAQVTLDGPEEQHDQRRTLLGGGRTFRRILDNLRAVVEVSSLQITIRINIDARNQASVGRLLNELEARGFGHRKNFSVYFAPVEAVTQGCHNIAHVCMSKSEFSGLESDLIRYAFERGLTSLPYPGRFRGICAAIRPKGFVIAPNGDLHKCWDTISMAKYKVGSVFDVEASDLSECAASWIQWDPFRNEACSNCRILPNCAGACAHKFLNQEQTRGEGASLPCPSWRYNINERLILLAEHRGAIRHDDYDPLEIRTDPSHLCVM